jgi:predicted ATPase
MHRTPGGIRTPDQRLRVFVSSTLKELAADRRGVRAAIERIGLTPVMFELGARPHPPRDLYRAYLEQSDIFVGLYAERYGWVAPGETVSGLEDEYALAAPGMPKLIYIKETDGDREPRLNELLDRIRRDGGASFKYYAAPEELGPLVAGDLAVLLAERFDRGGADAATVSSAEPRADRRIDSGSAIPAPLTELIGREDEVGRIRETLLHGPARLLTLTGPGGIGKTRIAIELAGRVADRFPDGVTFVPLAAIDDPGLVESAVAQALGIRDPGTGSLGDAIRTALRDSSALLILDNFEQVLPAAGFVHALLSGTRQLKVLITSRAPLRVSGEHTFEVGPLALPTPGRSRLLPASVVLFVERARAVRPDFELHPGNLSDVEGICVRLEGVPLAIELAAARIRILSPASLLERLDRQLAMLVDGQRDLPPRQRALRNTIEWSAKLLEPSELDLLAKLGVFVGRFSLEAAECIAEDPGGADVLGSLGALVDSSLLRQQDREGRTMFGMLTIVREYALERLDEAGLTNAIRARHAGFYGDLARIAQHQLKTAGQLEMMARLDEEHGNLRAAMRHLLDAGEWDAAANLAWGLFLYWWAGGHSELLGWMAELLDPAVKLSDHALARVLFLSSSVDSRVTPTDRLMPAFRRSVELFRSVGDREGEAQALSTLGFALTNLAVPDPAAAREANSRGLELFQELNEVWGQTLALLTAARADLLDQRPADAVLSLTRCIELARSNGDLLSITIAQHHLASAYLLLGEPHRAQPLLVDGMRSSLRVRHREGVAYALEGFVALAALERRAEHAGMLFGAADALRESAGLPPPDQISGFEGIVGTLRSGPDAAAFERGFTAGRMMSPEEALAATRLSVVVAEA